MNVYGTITGTLATPIQITGTLASNETIQGVLTVPSEKAVDYHGEYNITPTEEEQTLPTKDKKLGENVTVNAISRNYVGSGVPRKTSTDLVNAKATVSVPSGYYAENASKTIPTGSAVPATAILATNATASVQNGELVVNRVSKNAPFVTEGYIEQGTMGDTNITLKAPATNISAENIKKDVNILGVIGTYETPYTWQGNHAEFVQDIATLSYNLKTDTSYSTWTPSTTAGSIKATGNHGTFVADMTRYEYIIEWLWYVQMAYPDGQTYTACTDRCFGSIYQCVMRRPYGLANFEAQNWAYNYCTNDYTSSQYIIYWNTSGTKTWTGTSYGVYCSSSASTLSNTGADAPTVTFKRPIIYAKCNSSYFSTTRAGEVDQANTTIKMVGKLYRADINTTNMHYQWAKAIDMYNNPL